ncbi:MAG: TlyA family RNA methyltransferase [Pseudomonadota bacterium]
MTEKAGSALFERLDQAMVNRGLAESRSRAADQISRGRVLVDGAPAKKAAQKVQPASEIVVDDPAQHYVSRAALKLIAALDHFGFDPAGLHVLDVGASTGGFTQVLLERGARHVTALDVGHGQLHSSLSNDSQVTNLEGFNARDLKREDLAYPIEALVTDVSFISLTVALPAALGLAKPDAFAALLVKPQFEVGRKALGKGGIVRNEADARNAADRICDWLNNQPGWDVKGLIPSPIRGGDGNLEYLAGAVKHG